MKKILVIGAGLSASSLIRYLLNHAEACQWIVNVADANLQMAQSKVNNHPLAKALELNINDQKYTDKLIAENDLIISMLPAALHFQIAQSCLLAKKNLLTASYISSEMQTLDQSVRDAGLLFLNECGLDPGIDHMSAMRMMDQIRKKGGQITSFKSYCGGLISPQSDNNPWHYKFTWNPRNVVLAGQNTARFRQHGELKFIPPTRIFTEIEKVSLPDGETFDCYANRDSLEYLEPYQLQNANTILRGTMRTEGYCESWNHLVRLGLTDDSFKWQNAGNLTWRQLMSAFTPGENEKHLENRVADFLNIDHHSDSFKRLEWLGLFSNGSIGINDASPAAMLQSLLIKKWKLEPADIDRIVMYHHIEYTIDGKSFEEKSSLIVTGQDSTYTAMANTVGLPLAMAARLLLENKIKLTGVIRPTMPELYQPILDELATHGISFT